MNAAQARQLAAQSLPGAIEQHMAEIHIAIEEAAKQGRWNLPMPLLSPCPRAAQMDAIRQALRTEGYRLVDHPEPPRPHSPVERAWTDIVWETP